jgi:hypothetical protein
MLGLMALLLTACNISVLFSRESTDFSGALWQALNNNKISHDIFFNTLIVFLQYIYLFDKPRHQHGHMQCNRSHKFLAALLYPAHKRGDKS